MRRYLRISVFYCFSRSLWKTVKRWKFFTVHESHGYWWDLFFICFKRGFDYSRRIKSRLTKMSRAQKGKSRITQNVLMICWQTQAAMTKLKQNLGAGHCSTNGCQRSYRGAFCMCVCVPLCMCVCVHAWMHVCVCVWQSYRLDHC